MPHEVVNFARKFDLLAEQWQPQVVAELNDYQFKVVRIEGDFIWHDHPETDEAFIVLHGQLRIKVRDRSVVLEPGDMFVVPKTDRAQAVRRRGVQEADDRTARHL